MKQLPDRYVYPVVFTYYGAGEEIAAVFPDLDCATSGMDDEDALFSARELLGGRLALLEEFGEEIPAPTPLRDVPLEENERAALVDVYMPTVRMAEHENSVKQTVTLPAWLNSAAQELGLNISQVLQEALKAAIRPQRHSAGV